jgi:hypothetical protein
MAGETGLASRLPLRRVFVEEMGARHLGGGVAPALWARRCSLRAGPSRFGGRIDLRFVGNDRAFLPCWGLPSSRCGRRPRSFTGDQTKKANKFSGPPSPTRVRRNDSGRLIRKCPELTISVQTSPTAHPKFHGHDGALHGQVLKISEIPAVPACRLLAASWARAYLRPNRRDHPATSIPLGVQNPHSRPWGPI